MRKKKKEKEGEETEERALNQRNTSTNAVLDLESNRIDLIKLRSITIPPSFSATPFYKKLNNKNAK